MAQKHAPSPWDSLRERFRSRRPDSCSVYGSGPENFVAPQDNVHAISPSEVTATLFWGSHPAKPDEKIAFIGRDPLLSNLLRQGLCLNIFSSAQSIQYHIWGAEQTTGILPGLSQITMDKTQLHQRPWQEEQALLAGMDRIVLCDAEEKNLAVLSRLWAMRPCPHIYLYGNAAPGLGQATTFGKREDTLRREIVLEEALLREAKALNSYYRMHYGGKPWEQLEPFKRMSSISSAGYFPVLRRLFKAGIPMETLSELEHIRWNRFHYLQGWQYAPERDNEKKLHNCLIPYSRLSEEEKQKDRNNVMLALSLAACGGNGSPQTPNPTQDMAPL